MSGFPAGFPHGGAEFAEALLVSITAAAIALFALRRLPPKVLVAWLIAQGFILAVLEQLTPFTSTMILLGVIGACLVRDTPAWSVTRFSLATFEERSVEGRGFELEWLGFKLLIAVGRLPQR